MRGSVAAALVAAALLFVVVTASSEESFAGTSDSSSHMSAAERALLGYINVRGPRKNWINHTHRVHLLKQQKKQQKKQQQVVYRYEKFPMRKFLEPLKVLASRLQKERAAGLRRYKRLRQLLVRRGLLTVPGNNNKTTKKNAAVSHNKKKPAAASAIVVKKSAHELQLEKELAVLRSKITKREDEIKMRTKVYCDNQSVYFCFRGRCACVARANAKCASKSHHLDCRSAPEVGSVCRCAPNDSAIKARARHSAAKSARKQYWKTCNVASRKCRRARASHRHITLRQWAARRKFLNKNYRKVYSRYLELLASYFQKKFLLMIRELKKKQGNNVELTKKLKNMLAKHKAAMMKHAKLHHEAFMRFSTLMSSYRALNDKYNKLVDKYDADMKAVQARVAKVQAKVTAEQAKEDKLKAAQLKTEEKIRFLSGDADAHKKKADQSEADFKRETQEHAKLIKQFEKRKNDTLAELANSDAVIGNLTHALAQDQELINTITERLGAAKRKATNAANRADNAYKALRTKFTKMQKQADDAAAHDKAALAALRASNQVLTQKLADLKKKTGNETAQAGTKEKELNARLKSVSIKALKDEKEASEQVDTIKKKISTLKQKTEKAKSNAKADAAKLAALNASSGTAIAAHKQLAANNLKLQTQLRRLTLTYRKRVNALKQNLRNARTQHKNALAVLAQAKRTARNNISKDKALRGVYNRLMKKFEHASARQKRAESALVRLRNKITETKNHTAVAAAVPRSRVFAARRGSLSCGAHYAAERAQNQEFFARRFHGYDFYKIRVDGAMTSSNIAYTCRSRNLQTPCDHVAYANGKCVSVLKNGAFMSYNPHHNFPRWLGNKSYWYTSSTDDRSLFNTGVTHRWSTPQDTHGYTFCVLPAPCKPLHFRWKKFDFYRVRTTGVMTNKNIAKTCRRHGLEPVCDHPGYADGECVVVQKTPTHLSNPHPGHGLHRAWTKNVYFYAGAYPYALQNYRNTHRWAAAGDMDGLTYCVSPSAPRDPTKVIARSNRFKWHRVRVHGRVTGRKIRAACRKHGYLTPCEHPAYRKGSDCVRVTYSGRHLGIVGSTKLPHRVVNQMYFYAGRNAAPLQSWNGHIRWATKSDKHGDTLCVERVKLPEGYLFTHNNFMFFRENVNGTMTPTNVRDTCSAKNMFTPCDHPAYADGHCVVVVKRSLHLSYNPHRALVKDLETGTDVEADRRRLRRLRHLFRRHHRHARHHSRHHRHHRRHLRRLHRHHRRHLRRLHRRHRRHARHLRRLLRHHRRHHLRHALHARRLLRQYRRQQRRMAHHMAREKVGSTSLNRVFFYAGEKNRLLVSWQGSHRWSDDGDVNGETVCVTPVEVSASKVVAEYHGYKFHKVLVEGKMTNANILAACSRKGYHVPCDHKSYADEHCEVVNETGHMSYNAHHSFPRSVIDRTYWYTGAHPYPLQNWRNTHRWANPAGDMWEYTLCVE